MRFYENDDDDDLMKEEEKKMSLVKTVEKSTRVKEKGVEEEGGTDFEDDI